MKNPNKKPAIEAEVNLSYSKGKYTFFCKSVATLFAAVIGILSTAGTVVTGSAAAALVAALWIVHHYDKKLEGIDSISSSVLDNCKCAAWRKIAGCICQHCYAHNQQAVQGGLREHNVLNGLILRNVLLPVAALRRLPILFPYLRIESFGDVANVTQARNYIRIIKAFPGKRCAIWSKNLAIWAEAFKLEGKPKNTTFVFSSPYVDKQVAETIVESFPFIDHIFTVYTKKYARENNININCGGRKCLECIRKKTGCYYRGGTLYINEELK